MLQIVGRMRNNLSTSESDSKPEFSFSFILLAWITTKGDSGFMKRSNTPVIILVDKIPRRFLDSEESHYWVPRVLFLYVHKGPLKLEEQRLLCTLYGCMNRRVGQMLAWGSTDFIILAHSCRGRLFSLDARAYLKWQYRLGLCGNLLFL